MTEQTDWYLEGNYFETCNCEAACPCVWLQPATEGDCKLLVAWHIETGNLDTLSLDGLNVVLACFSPGAMTEGNWKAALYVDERANDLQFEALTQIFSGQAGGHFSVLMSFVGEVLGIKQVNIDFQADGSKRKLVVSDIALAEIESIQGIKGGDASIENPPLCIAPSHPAVVARSNEYRYVDYGFNWEFSERNGYHSPFVYQP